MKHRKSSGEKVERKIDIPVCISGVYTYFLEEYREYCKGNFKDVIGMNANERKQKRTIKVKIKIHFYD